MSFDLQPIVRVDDITPAQFQRDLLQPNKPAVMTRLARQWPAFDKWSFDYMREVAGDAIVPLYDDAKADATKKVNEPTALMPLTDYLNLLERERTNLRIFAFNIFKHAPQLLQDYRKPDHLMGGFLDTYPMMFFAGSETSVFIHYDIDLPHLFHTHFVGRKKCILFPPEASTRLYKLPFAIHNIEDIDINNPDYDKWPALRGLQGYECTLEHGDTLYMPTGWWHYMTYETPGFSLSLRALDPNPLRKLHSVYNVLVMRNLDNLARKAFGAKWFDWKYRRAIANANSVLPHIPVERGVPEPVVPAEHK